MVMVIESNGYGRRRSRGTPPRLETTSRSLVCYRVTAMMLKRTSCNVRESWCQKVTIMVSIREKSERGNEKEGESGVKILL
jgi:hypothetical protein